MFLRTSRFLALSWAFAWLLVSSAPAQGVGTGGAANAGSSPVVSPFVPAPGSGDGGVYTPPGDQGIPDDGSGETEKKGNPRQRGIDPSAPTSVRGGRGGQSRGTSRPGASGAGMGTLFGQDDSWIQWWETNKFDFIRLRRVRDTPITGQGRVEETPEERDERLQATDNLIRLFRDRSGT